MVRARALQINCMRGARRRTMRDAPAGVTFGALHRSVKEHLDLLCLGAAILSLHEFTD